ANAVSLSSGDSAAVCAGLGGKADCGGAACGGAAGRALGTARTAAGLTIRGAASGLTVDASGLTGASWVPASARRAVAAGDGVVLPGNSIAPVCEELDESFWLSNAPATMAMTAISAMSRIHISVLREPVLGAAAGCAAAPQENPPMRLPRSASAWAAAARAERRAAERKFSGSATGGGAAAKGSAPKAAAPNA